MKTVDSLILRLEFKDPSYVPDAQGMDNIGRLVNDIFKKGGVLVLPETITAEWLHQELDNAIKSRLNEGKTVDFHILGALKAITLERVRLEFPESE